MDRGDIIILIHLLHFIISVIMALFLAILIFIVFLNLPTSKKIKKRIGKLIDKGIATEKNVRISAILSIIIPGLGQIYNGEVLRGILYIILIGSSGIIAMILFEDLRGMIIYVIIEIIFVIDAYRMAVNINRSLVKQDRVPKKNVNSVQKWQ